MSPKILLAVILGLALLAILRGVVRGLRRGPPAPNIGARAAADPAHFRQANPRPLHACSVCGGFGFTTVMRPTTETRSETQTEFYTDYSGRPATRVVTRPRTHSVLKPAQIPCGFCAGSGRSRT
jgi:hypothetical protein